MAELVEKNKRREGMTAVQRAAEDADTMQTTMQFNQMMESMDPQQRQIVINNLSSMMPSSQLAYMKRLIDSGAQELLPPTKDEVKDWKGFYLSYFNSDLSEKKGRKLPQYLCVPNPRPDEVMGALTELDIKAMLEVDKKRPNDLLHPGRIKFKLFDNLGNLLDPRYKSKK